MSTCIVGDRLSPAGGVSIMGIDVSLPLSPDLKIGILDALRDHHFVVFPGQVLSREAQCAFAANFGEIEPPVTRNARAKRHAVAHVITNLDSDGKPVDRSSSPVSNYRWHTDKSYHAVPPMLTALYAVELPPAGGDTEFANTATGYAELPDETKRRIAGLRVVFYWGGEPPKVGRQLSLGRRMENALARGASSRTHPSGDRQEGTLSRQPCLAHSRHARD